MFINPFSSRAEKYVRVCVYVFVKDKTHHEIY